MQQGEGLEEDGGSEGDSPDIETGADTLLSFLEEKTKFPVSDIADDLGVPEDTVKTWAKALEESGYIEITYSAVKGMVLEYDADQPYEELNVGRSELPLDADVIEIEADETEEVEEVETVEEVPTTIHREPSADVDRTDIREEIGGTGIRRPGRSKGRSDTDISQVEGGEESSEEHIQRKEDDSEESERPSEKDNGESGEEAGEEKETAEEPGEEDKSEEDSETGEEAEDSKPEEKEDEEEDKVKQKAEERKEEESEEEERENSSEEDEGGKSLDEKDPSDLSKEEGKKKLKQELERKQKEKEEEGEKKSKLKADKAKIKKTGKKVKKVKPAKKKTVKRSEPAEKMEEGSQVEDDVPESGNSGEGARFDASEDERRKKVKPEKGSETAGDSAVKSSGSQGSGEKVDTDTETGEKFETRAESDSVETSGTGESVGVARGGSNFESTVSELSSFGEKLRDEEVRNDEVYSELNERMMKLKKELKNTEVGEMERMEIASTIDKLENDLENAEEPSSGFIGKIRDWISHFRGVDAV